MSNKNIPKILIVGSSRTLANLIFDLVIQQISREKNLIYY